MPLEFDTGDGVLFANNEILVKFKSNIPSLNIAQIHNQNHGQVKNTIPSLGVQIVAVPKDGVLSEIQAYSVNPAVSFVEPNYSCRIKSFYQNQLVSKQSAESENRA